MRHSLHQRCFARICPTWWVCTPGLSQCGFQSRLFAFRMSPSLVSTAQAIAYSNISMKSRLGHPALCLRILHKRVPNKTCARVLSH